MQQVPILKKTIFEDQWDTFIIEKPAYIEEYNVSIKLRFLNYYRFLGTTQSILSQNESFQLLLNMICLKIKLIQVNVRKDRFRQLLAEK